MTHNVILLNFKLYKIAKKIHILFMLYNPIFFMTYLPHKSACLENAKTGGL